MLKKNKGKVIWLYGRPCSGKTTLAFSLAEILKNEGISVITLDGDEFRNGINGDLGYTLIDRYENIRRASEIAKMLSGKCFWVICSFVTPTREMIELVERIISDSDLYLIYIHASLEICMQRDVKGHYSKAEKGQISNFTGISSPFESPLQMNDIIDTNELSIYDATIRCLKMINEKN